MEIYLNHDIKLLLQCPNMVGRHKIVDSSLVTIMIKTTYDYMIDFLTKTATPRSLIHEARLREFRLKMPGGWVGGGGPFALFINIPPLLL